MGFLRTASTRRLLAAIVSVVVAAGAASAIAVAATGGGATPPRRPLATALHRALAAPAVKGITADIRFTNNLIDSADFTGETVDPVLQGAAGRLWLSDDGRMRLELQSDDGDAQVVVSRRSFWISDPAQHTVYEGDLPADGSARADAGSPSGRVPSVQRLQSLLKRLARHLDVSGAQPANVAGQPAYRVTASPAHDGGLIGSAQLAWDAMRGVPLELGIYARGSTTPVLGIKATHIAYGAVADSDLSVSPPSGAKVVRIPSMSERRHGTGARHPVTGARRVAAALPFALRAPDTLAGMPRRDVRLIDSGSRRGAIVAYGTGLGGIVVVERPAGRSDRRSASPHLGNLSLPTRAVDGATAQELSTALGTVIGFQRGGVSYSVLGSVPAATAEAAARGL